MTDINFRDERTLVKYKKRMERELSRLRIENSIAIMLRDMERGISEQVERERQRNLTATYTRMIMENSSDRFILLDENLRLLLLSHNFEVFDMQSVEPGMELEELMGKMPVRSTPDDIASFREALENIMITGQSMKHSLTIGKDEDARYFNMIAKSVDDDGFGHKGLVLTFTETTALTLAVQEAQSADKAKSAFLANMSHEIRTPINAIVGISEIALDRGGLSSEMQGDLSIIQNSATGLLNIINDILDFSKIESGKFEIVPVEYAMPSMLMDICNMIRVKLVNSPVRLLMNVDTSLPFNLYGDDIRVKQVLLNLLNNATKFTHAGFIELRADGERISDNRIKLVVKIIDSGIGIRKEDIGKLFGTFSQVDTRRNRSITGSGLGLAISRNLAELMGGGITVESEYGTGSTFTVTLIQEIRGTKNIGSVKEKDNISMLVVEDDEVLIDSIGRTLQNLGIRWQVCRMTDNVRAFEGFTHVMVMRKNFETYREKLEFMFKADNIYLVMDHEEMASADYFSYKQLQLPLLALQLINALNGDEIVSSMKKESFKRSQIVPLTFARVLIVDDNATNLQVAEGLMAPYKMQIDTAPSGYKAIEMVRNTQYDAIFMDHMMPEMDGVEATHYIRNLEGEYFRKVPIIALTANAMSDARDMFIKSGMDDFISKPIEMVELNRVIKKFIEIKAPKGYLEEYKNRKEPVDASVTTPSAFRREELKQTGDVSVLGELLQQNNMLLNQNSMILQQLFDIMGNRSSGEVFAGVQMPAADRQAENAREGLQSHESVETSSSNDEKDGIPGVNMESAIEGCGGVKEVYENILATYSADIRNREQELEDLYNAHDIKGFTIVVHALKSASRSIGAADLGEAAFSLEKHGKAEDWEAIEQEYPAFIADLREMAEQVELYLNRNMPAFKDVAGNEKELLPAFSAEAVQRLQASCEDMDYMQVEEILKEMNEFSYPQPMKEALQSMLKACDDFEYETLETLVAGLKQDGE